MSLNSPARTADTQACELLGSQAALARAIGASPALVWQWIKGVRPVPLQYCTAIDRATDGAVSRRDLRPDDWGDIWPELIDAEHPWPAKAEAA